jgi:hypothetical protein
MLDGLGVNEVAVFERRSRRLEPVTNFESTSG